MSKKNAKTKLCWNCDGAVDFAAENCPYCGVSVVPASLDGKPANFSPPYRMGTSQETAVPRSLYSSVESQAQDEEKEEPSEVQKPAVQVAFGSKKYLMTVLFLSCGVVLALFGAVLALFSQDGVLTLQWDGSLWFVYLAVSLPLLILGWRWLQQLDAPF